MVNGPPPIREHRQWTPLARALAATGDQWTLLIALELSSGALRLSQLRSQLPGVSTGVLSRHLQHMVALGLLARRRFRELPPRVEYELTESGRELLPIVGALARWGMARMWSAPQPREQVDVCVLLRLLPVLLEDVELPPGVVELAIEHTEQPANHLFNIVEGRLQPIALGSTIPWVSISGSPGDWIAALGPARANSQLRMTGDEQLGNRILEAFPRRA
ncbi:MAG TPA: helix-turn-helix domain-containing protein [Solirubrobacteraceae bacterium]|nr:helix-turn-helix domain-containing protein [Solirubrobacteraceae bacterium]